MGLGLGVFRVPDSASSLLLSFAAASRAVYAFLPILGLKMCWSLPFTASASLDAFACPCTTATPTESQTFASGLSGGSIAGQYAVWQLTACSCVSSRATKKSRGISYVQFTKPEDATAGMGAMDGSIFQGRLLHVLPARKAPAPPEQPEKVPAPKADARD